MGRTDTLIRLGRFAATLQDEQLRQSDFDVATGRARLLAARRSRAARIPMSALAAAAALLLVLVALLARDPGFQVGSARGETGAWITAPAGAELPVRFADGTVFSLEPGSRARVAQVSRSGAEIVVEGGRIHAQVVPKPGARWSVHLGPFEVRVTGTRFTAAWDPASEEFSLSLEEGSVEAVGPLLAEPRRVAAGHRVRVSLQRAEVLFDEAASEPAASAPGAMPTPPIALTPTADAEQPAPKGPSEHPAPTWRDHARNGKFRDALEAAERAGFDRECEQASVDDLVLLADAARFAGDAGRASTALHALRRRFGGSPRAASAAFLLGKLAFDRQVSPAAAADWFATYLREQPGGPLAREAAGRLIEARRIAGDRAGAKTAARSYLEHYPSGPHAALARDVVDE